MSQLSRLAERFSTGFTAQEGAWRTLGREAEHPVVEADGTAGDVARLWDGLAEGFACTVLREGDLIVGLEGTTCTYSAEVGKGTIEVIVGPHDDLHGIRDAYEDAMARLLRVASAEGLSVLGYGIQPVTAPHDALMTPKRRYELLREVLGEAWLWFSVTASDQTHVSVGRSEVIAATNLVNALSPVVVGLTANSPVFGGRDAGVCSAREAEMGRIHAEAFRHGMPGAASRDAEDWVRRSMSLDYLMHRHEGGLAPVGQTFGAWIEAAGLDDPSAFTAWSLHDHYIWNSARPRTAHGTLELRSPCQQPGDSHMAGSALAAGMVAAHARLQAWLDDALGAEAWPVLRRWHHQVIRDGLAAEEPVPGLVDAVLDRCGEALATRGRGEEAYLAPLRARWAARRNPAQQAREVFAAGGAEALVRHVALG